MNKRLSGSLLVAIAAFFFVFAHVLGPLTYGKEGNNVFTLLLLNNAFAAPVLAVIMKFFHVSFRCSRPAIFPLLALGILGTAGTSLLLNSSFLYAGVGIGSMLHMSYIIIVEITDSVLLRQRIRGITIVTLIIVCLGVFFLSAGDLDGNYSALGIILALLSGGFYALYWLGISHTAAREEHPLRVQFYCTLFAAVIFFLYASLSNQLAVATMTYKAWALNFVCGILASVLAYLLTQVGIRQAGAAEAAIMGTLEPITGVVLGCILLSESLTPLKVLGCLCIFTGILLKPLLQLLHNPLSTDSDRQDSAH